MLPPQYVKYTERSPWDCDLTHPPISARSERLHLPLETSSELARMKASRWRWKSSEFRMALST